MRKRIFIFLLFTIGHSIFLIAQIKKFNIGIEAGPGFTYLRGNEFSNDYNKIAIGGYSFGFTFQYNFSKVLSFKSNIDYEKKGAIDHIPATDDNGTQIGTLTFHENFNYFAIPLLLQLCKGNNIKFYLNAGPYIAYLIQQNSVMEEFNEFQELRLEQTENYNRIDYGLAAGLGFEVPIKDKLSLTMALRNKLGFHNVSKVHDGGIKLNSTNLLMGIIFPL
jgi:hypothetical protein